MFTSHMVSSVCPSKKKTHLLLLWDVSLVTMHTLCVYPYNICGRNSPHLITTNRVSRSLSFTELSSQTLCIMFVFFYIFSAFTTTSEIVLVTKTWCIKLKRPILLLLHLKWKQGVTKAGDYLFLNYFDLNLNTFEMHFLSK